MAKTTKKQTPKQEDKQSFAAQLAELRANMRRQTAAAEAKLASEHVKQTRKSLAEHVAGSKDQLLQQFWKEFDEASRLAQGATDGGGEGGGTRPRRSSEDVKADADKLFKIIQDAGSIDSIALSAKIKEAGIVVSGTVFKFLEAAGHKVKTTGERRSMVYFAK